ncbi:hypothetical protein ACFV30_09440 [Streptomyces sp. NPDC059752]|uniref:hypothetical protein n=1 Tax=unclassified Streptomyces TaxID=2593676 RepID=UPI0036624C0D
MLEAFRVAAETGVDVRLVVSDHPHNRAAVARQYRDYWAQLVADPTPGTLNDWVDAENPIPDPWPPGTSVVFSPHTHTTAQDRCADLFGSARNLVCITFPFNFDPRFADQLPGDHPALRWLLFEDAGHLPARRSTCSTGGALRLRPREGTDRVSRGSVR